MKILRLLAIAWAVGIAVARAQAPEPLPPERAPVKDYTLSPDELRKAEAFAHAGYIIYFGSEAAILLALGAAAAGGAGRKLDAWARARSGKRWLQVWLVAAPLLLLAAAAVFPFDIYAEIVSRRFGQSIESWPAWAADWAKAEALILGVGTLAAWGIYGLMRRSPRRWWAWVWLLSLPIQVAGVVAEPLIIEPMFYHFDPLTARHPRLAAQIEEILQRAGISIPPERLYEMRASEKTNSLNAYVSGFGPSKRVVLYDTIIAKENGPPLLTTVGHELGHYALHHIGYGILFGFAVSLAVLWIAARALGWMCPGAAPGAWETMPQLLLVATLASFLLSPAINGFSRQQEHAADVYSIEVTHGVIPDPGQAAAQAFQIEGEQAFAEPDPNPLVVWWMYSHPPVRERLRFSLNYNPWAPGRRPLYVN